MQEEAPGHIIKISLLGEAGVGKTNLLLRYLDDVFDESEKPTVGVDVRVRLAQMGGESVKLQFWDTAGQERFRAMATQVLRATNGAVVVYDVSRRETFDKVAGTLELIHETCLDCCIVIVGNKTDLAERRAVSSEEAARFAAASGCFFAETSAKTDAAGVGRCFELVARESLLKARSQQERWLKDHAAAERSPLLRLDPPRPPPPKRCC